MPNNAVVNNDKGKLDVNGSFQLFGMVQPAISDTVQSPAAL